MSERIINDFTVLFRTKLDEKSKQEIGKNIKSLLENAAISFDETETQRNLEPIIRMMKKLFDKAEIAFDADQLLAMPSRQALQKLAEMEVDQLQMAFDRALAKSGGIKIDFGDMDFSEMIEPLRALDKEVSRIADRIANTTKKSVQEIERSLKSLNGINDKRIRQKAAVSSVESTLAEVDNSKKITPAKAIPTLEHARDSYAKSVAEDNPWVVQYQYLLEFVSKYERLTQHAQARIKENAPELQQLYEQLVPKAGAAKISLEHYVDIANGNELTEYKNQPWAREKTLQKIEQALRSGITVKEGHGDERGGGEPDEHQTPPWESADDEPKKPHTTVPIQSGVDVQAEEDARVEAEKRAQAEADAARSAEQRRIEEERAAEAARIAAEAAAKKKKGLKVYRGIIPPEEDNGGMTRRQILESADGAEWWTNKKPIAQTYADQDVGGAILVGTISPKNPLVIDAGGHNFDEFAKMPGILANLEKFPDLMAKINAGEDINDIQRYVNETARALGYDVIEFANVNDVMNPDEFVQLGSSYAILNDSILSVSGAFAQLEYDIEVGFGEYAKKSSKGSIPDYYLAPEDEQQPTPTTTVDDSLTEQTTLLEKIKQLTTYIDEKYLSAGKHFSDFLDDVQAESGELDGELKAILTTLNLIDDKGNLTFDIKRNGEEGGGTTHNGALISDDFVLIERSSYESVANSRLPGATQDAAHAGMNIAEVLGYVPSKHTGGFFDVQSTARGHNLFENGVLSQDVVNATEEQLEQLIQAFIKARDYGFDIENGGSNVVYDREKGFSFYDLEELSGEDAEFWNGLSESEKKLRAIENLFSLFDGLNRDHTNFSEDPNAKGFAERIKSLIAGRGLVDSSAVDEIGRNYEDIYDDVFSGNVYAEYDDLIAMLQAEADAHRDNAAAIQEEVRAEGQLGGAKADSVAISDDIRRSLNPGEQMTEADASAWISQYYADVDAGIKQFTEHLFVQLKNGMVEFVASGKYGEVAMPPMSNSKKGEVAGEWHLHPKNVTFSADDIKAAGFFDEVAQIFTRVYTPDGTYRQLSGVGSDNATMLAREMAPIEDYQSMYDERFPFETRFLEEVETILYDRWFQSQQAEFNGATFSRHHLSGDDSLIPQQDIPEEILEMLKNHEQEKVFNSDWYINRYAQHNEDGTFVDPRTGELLDKLPDDVYHLETSLSTLNDEIRETSGLIDGGTVSADITQTAGAAGKAIDELGADFREIQADALATSQEVGRVPSTETTQVVGSTDAKPSVDSDESRFAATDSLRQLLEAITYSVKITQGAESAEDNKISIDESVLEGVLNRITYSVKFAQDADGIPRGDNNAIDAEALKIILGSITYNVKHVMDTSERNNDKLSVDEVALEAVLNKVFASILNPEAKQDGTESKGEPWALESTLNTTIKGILDNIQNNTSKIGTTDTTNVDPIAGTTLDTRLTEIKSVLDVINGKIVQGTKVSVPPAGAPKSPGATTSDDPLFKAKVDTRFSELSLLYTKLESNGKMTDEIRQKYELLWQDLDKVGDKGSLSLWQQELMQVKNEIQEILIKNGLLASKGKATFQELIGITRLYNQMVTGAAKAPTQELQAFYTEEANRLLQEQSRILNEIDLTEEQRTKYGELQAARQRELARIQAQAAGAAHAEQERKIAKELGQAYDRVGQLTAQIFVASGKEKEELERQLVAVRAIIAEKKKGLQIDEAEYEARSKAAEIRERDKIALQGARREDRITSQDERKQALAGKAGNAIGRADNVRLELLGLDEEVISEDHRAEFERYFGLLDELKKKHAEIQNSKGPIKKEDKQALIAQTVEIGKLTEKMSGLIAEYQRLSGSNVDETRTVATTLTQSSGMDEYEEQLKQYVRTITDGKGQIKNFDAQTRTLTYTVKTGKNEFTEYTAAVRHLDHQMVSVQGTTKRTETFFEATARKMKELTSYFSGMAIFSRISQELRRGIQYIREIDLALTELRKVTDATEESYDEFLQTASKIGERLGTTISAVTEATSTFAKLGYTMEQATEMAESAIVYKNVGDNIASTEDAADSIISTMKGFGMEASEAMEIVDRFNEVKFLPPYTAMYMIKMAISEKF